MKDRYSVYSCLAYITGGVILILIGGKLLIFAGIAQILLGIASAGFHYTYRYFWQKADEIMILFSFNALLARQIGYFVNGWDWYLIIGFTALSVIMGITHRKWDNDDVGLMGIYNLLILFVRSVGQGIAALVFYLVSLFFADQARIKDSHRHQDKPHAIWHIGTAMSNLLVGI